MRAAQHVSQSHTKIVVQIKQIQLYLSVQSVNVSFFLKLPAIYQISCALGARKFEDVQNQPTVAHFVQVS